jgi:NhaP-type Na+/H+ or K+/H+ antiporter
MIWKDVLIMSYAGLRGAISLSLAIFVKNEQYNESHID